MLDYPGASRLRLRHAAATRAFGWLSRRRVIRTLPGEHFRRVDHRVPLPHLPKALDGLRICHLTDLHVGRILTADHLPRIVDTANGAEADLIVVTGDLLDNDNAPLNALTKAMAQLHAPLGVYFVLGNHDYRENVGHLISAFDSHGLVLLINQVVQLTHHDRRIAIGGIDWEASDRRTDRLVNRLARHMPQADLNILLAHHPHAFDAAAEHGFDLTLSGHTHGGQMLLRRHCDQRLRPSLGLGNLKWRYPQGLYARNGARLFVSNGVGGSFPLRLRCPAEISILHLHRSNRQPARRG
jgi:hypothetical protein